MAKSYANYNTTIEDMDKKTRSIYNDLIAGKNKKQIANRHKVQLCEVMVIAQRYKTGLLTPQKTDNEVEETKAVFTHTLLPEEGYDKPMTEEQTTTTRGRGHNLTDDEILAIAEDLEAGELSTREIAEKNGCCDKTVLRIKREYLGIEPKRRKKRAAKKQAKNNDDIIKEDNTNNIINEAPADEANQYNVIFTKDDYVEAQLIRERHDAPCTKYIFDKIDDKLMFDYDALDEIVRRFIKANIKFENGVAKNGLMVYISGLVCVSASVIKVCAEMKVNLFFRHYNLSNHNYEVQTIFDSFGDTSAEIPKLLTRLTSKKHIKDIIAYRCTAEEILANNKNIYSLIINTLPEDVTGDIVYSSVYITLSLDDAYDLFKDQVTKAMLDKNTHKALFLAENYIEDGLLMCKQNICKSYNY